MWGTGNYIGWEWDAVFLFSGIGDFDGDDWAEKKGEELHLT